MVRSGVKEPGMSDRSFPPVTFEDMITHNDLLERHPWLTAQNLNKWRRSGSIRFFTGKRGMFVYPMGDIERALTDTLNASIEIDSGAAPSPIEPREHASTSHRGMSEADQIREQLWLRQINERKFPRTKNPEHKS